MKKQSEIKIGARGTDYRSWMSNPVFYVFGGCAVVTALLMVLSFSVFHMTVPGVIFAIAIAALIVLLLWKNLFRN